MSSAAQPRARFNNVPSCDLSVHRGDLNDFFSANGMQVKHPTEMNTAENSLAFKASAHDHGHVTVILDPQRGMTTTVVWQIYGQIQDDKNDWDDCVMNR